MEWHTHPQACEMDECSLACPSDTDVRVFVEDALSDNLTHSVFSLQGTFVVSLSPRLVVSMKAARDHGVFDAECAKIQRAFSDLQREFANRFSLSANEREKDAHVRWHITQWMRLADRAGLDVKLFPWGVAPHMDVRVQCSPGTR
eukprot:jgi/Mesvir1/26540/Mv16195-RA.1